jgi:hypothetical protein
MNMMSHSSATVIFCDEEPQRTDKLLKYFSFFEIQSSDAILMFVYGSFLPRTEMLASIAGWSKNAAC